LKSGGGRAKVIFSFSRAVQVAFQSWNKSELNADLSVQKTSEAHLNHSQHVFDLLSRVRDDSDSKRPSCWEGFQRKFNHNPKLVPAT
jgi:hypothetical protein